jgi:hypothetical protein
MAQKPMADRKVWRWRPPQAAISGARRAKSWISPRPFGPGVATLPFSNRMLLTALFSGRPRAFQRAESCRAEQVYFK